MFILAYLQTKAQENRFNFNRKEIYKNLYKDLNWLIKKDQCKNRNIFGQHASNGPNVERNFTRKRDIDFSVTKIMLYDKFKNSQATIVKEIEFLGLVINSVNMTLTLPLGKVLDIQNKCMQLTASPQ